MTDQTPDAGHDREYPGAPRWVKVLGIIVMGVILLVIVALVVATALGLHKPGGPGGHFPSSDIPFQTPLSNMEDNVVSSDELAGVIFRASVIEQGRQRL